MKNIILLIVVILTSCGKEQSSVESVLPKKKIECSMDIEFLKRKVGNSWHVKINASEPVVITHINWRGSYGCTGIAKDTIITFTEYEDAMKNDTLFIWDINEEYPYCYSTWLAYVVFLENEKY